MKILVVNDCDGLYSRFWGHLGEITRDVSLLFKCPEEIGLLAFTGGEDVSPELYGHKNLASHNSRVRDEREASIFRTAKEWGIPVSGICRGGQFLSVMYGNPLVQDLRNSHGGSLHLCQTHSGEEFKATSSHHQMIVPRNLEVLAWAEEKLQLGDLVYGGRRSDLDCLLDEEGRVKVTEAVCYRGGEEPESAGLPPMFSCQFHAEWMDLESEAAQWQLQMTEEICLRGANPASVTA